MADHDQDAPKDTEEDIRAQDASVTDSDADEFDDVDDVDDENEDVEA